MNRRPFLGLALALPLAAIVGCKKELRCKHCGMKIDASSPWRCELVAPDGTLTPFDAPRCAFASWRSGATAAAQLRAQEYYDRSWHTGPELVFAVGGDIVGPMGPDLVPLLPAHATKFIQDHGADRTLHVDEITSAMLATLK